VKIITVLVRKDGTGIAVVLQDQAESTETILRRNNLDERDYYWSLERMFRCNLESSGPLKIETII
jgi:hypothetical protein